MFLFHTSYGTSRYNLRSNSVRTEKNTLSFNLHFAYNTFPYLIYVTFVTPFL
ncbi:hypothetical protein PGB90_002151 [Kerria lacca]